MYKEKTISFDYDIQIDEYNKLGLNELINYFRGESEIEASDVKRLHTLNDSRANFVNTVLQIIDRCPDLFGAHFDNEKLNDDFLESLMLFQLLEKIRQLESYVKREFYTKGSATYKMALNYYNHLKSLEPLDHTVTPLIEELLACGCFKSSRSKSAKENKTAKAAK